MTGYQSLKVSAVVAGALLFGVFAFAQGLGGGQHQGNRNFRGGFSGGGRGNSLFLLRRDDVKADLQLTADQKVKLDDLMTSMRGNRGDRGDRASGQEGQGHPSDNSTMTDVERQARRAEAESRRAEMEKNVNAILTPAQVTRLKEISIQLRGNSAVLDADVQRDLGMTDEQKSKIKDLQQKMRDAMGTVFQKAQDGTISRQDAFQSMQKNNDIMNVELGKILSQSQKDKLKAMGGAPFKADPSESNFGGWRGGRGGN